MNPSEPIKKAVNAVSEGRSEIRESGRKLADKVNESAEPEDREIVPFVAGALVGVAAYHGNVNVSVDIGK